MPTKISIEQLAGMVQKGFQETASKGDIRDLREDMRSMAKKLDRIENRILEEHAHRINLLEDDMKRLKDAMQV